MTGASPEVQLVDLQAALSAQHENTKTRFNNELTRSNKGIRARNLERF